MKNNFSATIIFDGDTSVGVRTRAYKMGLDETLQDLMKGDQQLRDTVRTDIKKLYENLDGDQSCQVHFSDETID